MKRWIVLVLFSILISYPAVAGALDDTLGPGNHSAFGFPLLDLMGAGKSDSGIEKEKKKGEDWDSEKNKEKEKQATDKKVDDAIKKAWGEQ